MPIPKVLTELTAVEPVSFRGEGGGAVPRGRGAWGRPRVNRRPLRLLLMGRVQFTSIGESSLSRSVVRPSRFDK